MSKYTAVITGITGQDGSYLAEFLLSKDYRVVGIKRRTSSQGLGNVEHLVKELEIEEADVMDLPSISKIVKHAKPHEFYNLAAQSHVHSSFKQPILTMSINAIGTLNCLEAIVSSGYHTKFYQASTSELFGGLSDKPCSEETPFNPRSPYAISKLAAHWAVDNYRNSYRMFACSGILFNHESPRRGPNFVTQKIASGVAAIVNKTASSIRLGNIKAKRDWGHARDYVEAMYLMLQNSRPRDYVIGTGETHSVEEFLAESFKVAGIDNYSNYVEIDPELIRPSEVNTLIADSSRAALELGWKPKVKFHELVKEMVISKLNKGENNGIK